MTLVLTVGCVGEVSYAAGPESKQQGILETASDGDLIAVDISDNILHKGGLLKEYEFANGEGEETLPKYLAVDRDTYCGVEELLKAAYDSFAMECSLSQYQLTPAELKEVVAEVLNTNPRYFYVYGGYSYSWDGTYITRILPKYDYEGELAASMLREYDVAVRQAVKGASTDWSDLEKALYINDYLTRNCEYDTNYTNYDAYDVFVSKTAVCQGYALAYLELANQLGLTAEVVTSTSLNHAWNMIEINGKYYQEDATWNDPTSDLLGRARHLYFMKSTEYYQTGVNHFKEADWVVSGGLTWTDASSTDYDGCFWNNVDIGFEYIDGYWYGFDGADRIVKYDCDGSSLQKVEELLQIDDVWRVTGSNSYYPSKYLGVGRFDGKLYYSDTDTIYYYDLVTGIREEIYSLSEAEKATGSIYAMHITPAGEVYYYLTPSLNTTGTIYCATVLTKENPEPEVYSITYNLNGGVNHSDNPVSYTENDTVLFEIPTKANYVFDGWYTDAECTKPIVGISAGTTGNQVVYAKWIERVYDIRFDGNGSTSGQMSDLAGCLFDQSYILATNVYKRKGYVFKGWNTSPDGIGIPYEDGDSVSNLATIHGEIVTLYAQWEIEEYTITYELDGGINNSGNPASYTVNDAIVFEDANRENYIFRGWYTDEEFTDSIEGVATGTTGNLVLYAKWEQEVIPEIEEYNIVYHLDGGTNHGDNPASYTQDTETITLKVPTKTGHTFDGWYSDSDFATEKTQIATGSIGDVELYAKWLVNQYNIKFAGNGADSGSMSSMGNRKYGTLYMLTANAYKRTGYIFAGWNTNAKGTGTSYKNQQSVTSLTAVNGATITLYAQWTPIKYNIKFNKNGATGGSMSNMLNRKYDTSYKLTANAYKRTGYTFAGWNTKKTGKGTTYKNKASVKNLKEVNGGTVTLYAQWKPIEYTIKFNGNGATGGKMSNLSNRKYDKSYKLTANAYKKKGYTFAGWNTKKNGKGKAYKNKATVKNLTSSKGKVITLYAQWDKK